MRELRGAEYHRARAAMEMERAAEAADPKTATLHRQLAELHLLSAGEGEGLPLNGASFAPVDNRAEASR